MKASPRQDPQQRQDSYLVHLLQEPPHVCCIPSSPTELGALGAHPQSPFVFQHSSVGCQPLPGRAQTFVSLPSPPCFSPLNKRWAPRGPSVGGLDVSGQSRDSPGAHAEGSPEHLLLSPPPQSGLGQRHPTLQSIPRPKSSNSPNNASSDFSC